MSERRQKVFIDFDGTITTSDLGYEMFRHFTSADTEPLVQQYRRGEVNSLQCLGGECDIWNSHAPRPDDVYRFIETYKVAPGFREFILFLRQNSIEPLILSEGFDFYIEHFLDANNLGDIPKITNKASFIDGKLTPEFPYNKLGCQSCSSCKGYHISRLRGPADTVIFIGDGHSDLHGSAASEIVFAKSHLAEIMSYENRHYIPFHDFFGISKVVSEIISKNIFMISESFNLCYVDGRHLAGYERLWESGEVMGNVGYPNGLGLSAEGYAKELERLGNCRDAIYLAIEDKAGMFMGEVKLAFPDKTNHCHHDLKLLPEFQGRGIGYSVWRLLLERTRSRWPHAIPAVTPSIKNEKAIALYRKLGFEFQGDVQTWEPRNPRCIAINYRTMVYDKF
jgi:2-hydroxy-3-keto-5-methylthiopentenyl-1-phosphate phosphatase